MGRVQEIDSEGFIKEVERQLAKEVNKQYELEHSNERQDIVKLRNRRRKRRRNRRILFFCQRCCRSLNWQQKCKAVHKEDAKP